MTKEKIAKDNKDKKTNSNKQDNKNFKPILILIIISLIIAILLPYIRDKEKYIDTDISLNQLEQKYLQ